MAKSRVIPQQKTNDASRSFVDTHLRKEVFKRFKSPVRQHIGLWLHCCAIKIETASGSAVERPTSIEGLCGSNAESPIDLTEDDDVLHISSAERHSDAEDIEGPRMGNGEPSSKASREAKNEPAVLNARSSVQDAIRSGAQIPKRRGEVVIVLDDTDDEGDVEDAVVGTPWNMKQPTILTVRSGQRTKIPALQDEFEIMRERDRSLMLAWAALRVENMKEKRKHCDAACECHKFERLRETQDQSRICECHKAGLYNWLSEEFEDLGGFDKRGWPIMTLKRRKRWWAKHWHREHRIPNDEELINVWVSRTAEERHQGAPWAFDIKGRLYWEKSYLEPVIHARGLTELYIVEVPERKNGGRLIGGR